MYFEDLSGVDFWGSWVVKTISFSFILTVSSFTKSYPVKYTYSFSYNIFLGSILYSFCLFFSTTIILSFCLSLHNFSNFFTLSASVVKQKSFRPMFLLFSGDKAYSLVFATYDKNYFNTTEYKNIRNSFTIKNFSGQYYSYTNTIILIVVLSIGSILLIVAIISLFLKKKKKTLNTVNIDNMQYYQNYNDNQNNNYKF